MLIKGTVDVMTLRFGWTVCVHVKELLIFSKARDKDWYAQGLVYGCNFQMWIKGSISNLTSKRFNKPQMSIQIVKRGKGGASTRMMTLK